MVRTLPILSSSGFAICADPTPKADVELSETMGLAPAVLDRPRRQHITASAHQFLHGLTRPFRRGEAVSNTYCPATAAFTVAVSTRTPIPMVDETATFFR